MAMCSTLAAWLLVLVAMPLALEWSGTWSVVTERALRMNDAIGTPRAATVVLLILAGFIVATWKQLVQSLHIGLTGREWIVKGSVLLTLTFLILRSEEHTSELQSQSNLVCRLLPEKKKKNHSIQ